MMAARAIRAVPEAAGKIEDGSLTLVTLAKVQSVIRSEEKRTGERVSLEIRSTMIAQTENKTLRETERIAAEHFPEAMQAAGSQSFSSQNFSKQNYSNQIVFTEEQIKLLERVRELKSHANFGASLAEIVSALATEYLDRNDPLRREVKPRSVVNKSLVEESLAVLTEGSSQGGTTVVVGSRSGSKSGSLLVKGSEPVSVSETRLRGGGRRTSTAPSTRNFVRRRAGDACEYQGPGGQRCGSRFQTQIDHVIPVALGGTNDVRNLRLLCRTHNLLMAEKTLGLAKMCRFRKPL
jgi:5-methylcytosine-specific restriction endonuclease McrA